MDTNSDTTIIKVDSRHSPLGSMGEKHLAMSKSMSMRLWEEAPGQPKPAVRRDYETIGYVIGGRAELRSEGQTVRLAPGDSWVVPKGAEHSYTILEKFVAVEVTHPPAPVHMRDK
jgi:quercetin dioxygenase-like cupin family protein